jgi:hypothetical protein
MRACDPIDAQRARIKIQNRMILSRTTNGYATWRRWRSAHERAIALRAPPEPCAALRPRLSSTAAPARSAPACAVSRVRRPDPVRGTAYARASCLLRRRCRRPFFTIRRISSATVDRREALWSVHVSTLFNSDKPYTNYLIRGVIIGQRFMREQQPKQRGRQRPVSPPLPPTLCTAR